MLKKLVIASMVLATALTVTNAQAQAAGLYAGAGFGVQVNTSSNGLNYRGVPFNVFAGYGANMSQNFYLAGEIMAVPGTATLSNGSSLIKTSYGYGLSILPGVMLGDRTLGYARAGVVRSRFPSGGGTTSTGGQVGLGLQTSLTQNWEIRGEYIYTGYNRVNSTVGSPKADQANLGIVYKFDV